MFLQVLKEVTSLTCTDIWIGSANSCKYSTLAVQSLETLLLLPVFNTISKEIYYYPITLEGNFPLCYIDN